MSKLELIRLGLTNLHPQAFLGLGSLRYLDLSANNLTTLPDELFQWLGSISDINLAQNWLSDAVHVSYIMSALAQVKNIDLAVNHLDGIPDLSNSGILETLDLSYNQITNLPGADLGGPLRGLDRLTSLKLNNNQIDWVDGNFFK
jgi:Leucine-rich repeat (LRR) protein